MNRNTTLLLVLGGLLVFAPIAWWVKANYLEAGALLVTDQSSITAATRLKVQGDDIRTYEFPMKSVPGWTCIYVTGTGTGATFCVPNGQQKTLPATE